MSRSIGRFLSGLRGSSASGPHGKHAKDRANTERDAIDAELESDVPPVPQSWIDAYGLPRAAVMWWGGYPPVEERDADPS